MTAFHAVCLFLPSLLVIVAGGGILEKRPEILENNDGKIFKRDTNYNGHMNRDCEADLKQEDNNKCCFNYDHTKREMYDNYYSKKIQKRGLEEEKNGSTRNVNAASNDANIFDDGVANNDVDKVDVDNSYSVPGGHIYKRRDETFQDAHQGQDDSKTRKNMLTPEEVVQKAIQLEKMLEDHATKNKRK